MDWMKLLIPILIAQGVWVLVILVRMRRDVDLLQQSNAIIIAEVTRLRDFKHKNAEDMMTWMEEKYHILEQLKEHDNELKSHSDSIKDHYKRIQSLEEARRRTRLED